jgi:hypothetical protein
VNMPLPRKRDGSVDWDENWRQECQRMDAVRKYVRERQAREEEALSAAEAAASKPQSEETVSVFNLVIKNGVAQSPQPAIPSNTAIKTKQFEKANILARSKN